MLIGHGMVDLVWFNVSFNNISAFSSGEVILHKTGHRITDLIFFF